MKSSVYHPSALYIFTGMLCCVSFLVCIYMRIISHYHIWHLKVLFGFAIFGVFYLSLTFFARILIDDYNFYYKGRHPYKILQGNITRRVPLRDVYMIRWECKGLLMNASLSFACIINETFAVFTFPVGKMMIGPNNSNCIRLFNDLRNVCEVNDIGLVVDIDGKEFRKEISDSNYQKVIQQLQIQYGSDEVNIEDELETLCDELGGGESTQYKSEDVEVLFKRVKIEYYAVLLFDVFIGYAAYMAMWYIGII